MAEQINLLFSDCFYSPCEIASEVKGQECGLQRKCQRKRKNDRGQKYEIIVCASREMEEIMGQRSLGWHVQPRGCCHRASVQGMAHKTLIFNTKILYVTECDKSLHTVTVKQK